MCLRGWGMSSTRLTPEEPVDNLQGYAFNVGGISTEAYLDLQRKLHNLGFRWPATLKVSCYPLKTSNTFSSSHL